MQSQQKPNPGKNSGGFTPKPTRDRDFKKPVNWLLGRQLIASLKSTALYTAFGDKLDPKDWMKPEIFTFEGESDEFWFDYLADSGDGQKATYSIAYLCLSDLWVKGSNKLSFDSEVSLQKEGTDKDAKYRLPRGAFLFVGGDTTYHIADYATLANRFQSPFRWAFEDLKEDLLRDKMKKEEVEKLELDRRPLFGIPGNHDYYDSLDGFNRQFRRPFNPEEEGPQLSIRGFRRVQEASYVALQLPFDWWFLGLDTQEGKIDRRQSDFFSKIIEKQKVRKFMIATPEPSTVFGRLADKDSDLVQTFKKLGIERPFLEDGKLKTEQCRLDLSGDVHHYARHWGPGSASSTAPTADNYASVVSGLGGAFLHATHTDVKEVEQQQLYPSANDSRKEVSHRILKPWYIWNGGYIWLVGAIVAMIIYFAAIVPESSRSFVNWILVKTTSVTESQLSTPTTGVLSWLDQKAFYLEPNQGLEAFGYSTLVLLFCIILPILLVYLSSRYRRTLTKKATTRSISIADYLPIWGLLLPAALSPFAGLWIFGKYQGAVLVSDITFSVIFFGLTFGLIGFAVTVGGKLHNWKGKIGFGFLGVWHALLQTGVPFLIARFGDWRVLSFSLILAFAFIWIGIGLATRNRRWLLVLALLVHGSLQLGLPLVLGSPLEPNLLRLAIAFIFGAIMCCVWFGWYVAVSLAFNGHNNEAGGASRIERFKEFIRFRVTRDTLTAYVIGVDDPKGDGRKLEPKIVDWFELRCK